MSLRILFADDSVTAQNMGRKILTDAGYEVVAVSNGAAAVKKIAEQKPDIIILDVYMPGYSGLEVCEKVRGSVATLKTPVLLTVGKMEPYKPEEATRVRADGVIVKPFEASDLLAIVKKFEERIGQEPLVTEPAPVERFQKSAPEEPLDHPEPIIATVPQATVDVPDHMATSSAFSDLLGTDSAHPMNNFSAPPPVMRESAPPITREAPPEPTPIRNPIPEYGVPVSWREQIDGEAEPFSAAVPATNHDQAPPEAGARPVLQIPVYHEQEEVAPPPEVVPTAVPPTSEVEILRDPELQESAAEQTRSTIADARDPGLIPTLHEEEERERSAAAETVAPPLEPAEIPTPSFAEAMASVPAAAPGTEESVPVGAGADEIESGRIEDEDIEAEKSAVSDSDFEARVAAAMSSYSNAAESGPGEEPTPTAAKVASQPESVPARQIETPSAVREAVPAETVDAVPGQVSEAQPPAPFDYHPPAAYTEAAQASREAATDSLPVAHEPVVPPSASEATHQREKFDAVHEAMAASVEAAVPLAASAAAGAGAETDHHTIAKAVHRVMERLKPELVEEILRELKPKE